MNSEAGGGGPVFVIDAEPEKLLAAAKRFTDMGHEQATQATALGKTPANIGAAWQGLTASAIKSEMTALAGQTARFPAHFATAAQLLTGFAQALVEAQAKVRLLNQEYDAATQGYLKAVDGDEDASGERPSSDTAGPYAFPTGNWARAVAARDQECARLVGRYEALVAELGMYARRVGKELVDATVVPVPDQAVSSWLGHPVPARIGGGNLTPDQAALNALQNSLPLLHRREAEDAAEEVDKLLPAAATGDAEALRRILEEHGQWSADPYFAHALASALGPAGLTQIWLAMRTGSILDGDQRYLSESDSARLATYLGTQVAVASNPSYDHALDEASRDEFKTWREQQWLPGWVKAGNEFPGWVRPGYEPKYGSYVALTELLQASATSGAQPGAAFMGTVGADILRWDKKNLDFGFKNLQSSLARGIDVPNPVRSLLLAAKGDRAAEQALLLAPVDGEPAVRYLVKSRTSQFALLEGNPEIQRLLLNGDLLGEMVLHADMDRKDEIGTSLASEFAGAYIDGVYESKPGDGQQPGQSRFGGEHATLRPALAEILGYHTKDLTRALVRGDPVPQDQRPDGTWGIGFNDPHRLAATFADLAFDRPEDLGKDPAALAQDKKTPPALSLLLRDVMLHTGSSLTDIAHQKPLDTDLVLRSASNGATTLAYIVQSAQEGLSNKAEAEDAADTELAKWVSRGIGLIPFDKAPVVGGLVTGLTDGGLEALLPADHAAGRAPVDAEADTALHGLMGDQIETALANAGAWGATTPSEWLATDAKYDNPEARQFIDDRGRVLPVAGMTPFQRAAYGDFLSQDKVIGGALSDAQKSKLVGDARAKDDYDMYEGQ